MSKQSIGVLTGVLALGFLAACGSGDEGSLTKAEFIERGDAVCTAANKQSAKRYSALAKANEEKASDGNQRQERTLEEEGIEVGEKVIVPNAEDQADGLAGLSSPEGDETKIDAIVGAIEAGVAKATSDPSSFYGKSYPFDEANQLMREYGFKVCGGTNEA